MITQGMLHDRRVIQKTPRAYHLVESALGIMVNDVSLSGLLLFMGSYSRTPYLDQRSCVQNSNKLSLFLQDR